MLKTLTLNGFAATGDEKRRFPTGACAYGIPKNAKKFSPSSPSMYPTGVLTGAESGKQSITNTQIKHNKKTWVDMPKLKTQ